MKRWVIALTVLTAVFVLAGCRSEANESDFMVGFSLGSILEANKQFLSTQEIASGGTVSGPTRPFFQRREEAIVQIEPSGGGVGEEGVGGRTPSPRKERPASKVITTGFSGNGAPSIKASSSKEMGIEV